MSEHAKKTTTQADAAEDIIRRILDGQDVEKRMHQFFIKSDGSKRPGAAETMLFVAAAHNCIPAAKRAVTEGGDIKGFSEKWGRSPAEHAAEYGYPDFTERLEAAVAGKFIASSNRPATGLAALMAERENSKKDGEIGPLRKMSSHSIASSNDGDAEPSEKKTHVSSGMLKKMTDLHSSNPHTDVMTVMDDTQYPDEPSQSP